MSIHSTCFIILLCSLRDIMRLSTTTTVFDLNLHSLWCYHAVIKTFIETAVYSVCRCYRLVVCGTARELHSFLCKPIKVSWIPTNCPVQVFPCWSVFTAKHLPSSSAGSLHICKSCLCLTLEHSMEKRVDRQRQNMQTSNKLLQRKRQPIYWRFQVQLSFWGWVYIQVWCLEKKPSVYLSVHQDIFQTWIWVCCHFLVRFCSKCVNYWTAIHLFTFYHCFPWIQDPG